MCVGECGVHVCVGEWRCMCVQVSVEVHVCG